jgi:hypothetical protein
MNSLLQRNKRDSQYTMLRLGRRSEYPFGNSSQGLSLRDGVRYEIVFLFQFPFAIMERAYSLAAIMACTK